MKFILNISLLFLMINQFSNASAKEKVDLILFNGVIYTVDPTFSVVQALAIKKGKITAVGTDKQILSGFTADETRDLHGGFVYPGFIDAHSHFFGYALSLQYVDLNGCPSFEELIRKISGKKKHIGQWIVGRGWDQNLWTNKTFPDKTRLDVLFPDNPVVLIRVDGHVVLANENALRIAKISDEHGFSKGEVEIKNGKLTGILAERAAERMRELIPEPPEDEMIKLLGEAEQNLFGAGLTTVTDAGLEFPPISILDQLYKSEKLSIHLYVMLTPAKPTLDILFPNHGYLSDRITIKSLKVYADGSLGSRTACLKRPYSDAPSQSGILVINQDSLNNICKLAYDNGYQVNTHCIGDSAVKLVIDVYKKFLKGNNDLRWRIEHAQVVDPADIEAFRKFSIIPSVQATHATSDMAWAKDRLGVPRIQHAYAYKDLLQQNGWLANGTDFPIENISPVQTFFAAVFRKNSSGMPEGGFQPENALSREEALKSITIWAAKACFLENLKGSLEPGKDADLTIVDQDLMKSTPEKIKTARINLTFCLGKMVYSQQKD